MWVEVAGQGRGDFGGGCGGCGGLEVWRFGFGSGTGVVRLCWASQIVLRRGRD